MLDYIKICTNEEIWEIEREREIEKERERIMVINVIQRDRQTNSDEICARAKLFMPHSLISYYRWLLKKINFCSLQPADLVCLQIDYYVKYACMITSMSARVCFWWKKL